MRTSRTVRCSASLTGSCSVACHHLLKTMGRSISVTRAILLNPCVLLAVTRLRDRNLRNAEPLSKAPPRPMRAWRSAYLSDLLIGQLRLAAVVASPLGRHVGHVVVARSQEEMVRPDAPWI